MTDYLRIEGRRSGVASGDEEIALAIPMGATAASMEVSAVDGANVVNVPSDAHGVIVIPERAQTVEWATTSVTTTLTLNGVPISATYPSVITFPELPNSPTGAPNPPSTLTLVAGGTPLPQTVVFKFF